MQQDFLSKFIDSRNAGIWQIVSSNYNIELTLSPNEEYSIYTQNKDATIFVAKDYCIDSFTHELLHLHLDVKQVFVGSSLYLSRYGKPKLMQILSDPLVEHIGNCLNHIKMLPIYLELGFSREKFIRDYDFYKYSKEEINLTKQVFKSGPSYRANAVDNVIGKYIAIKADPNISFDYSYPLSFLSQLDNELFAILDDFYNDWLTLDIEKYDLFHNYRSIVDKFYEELNTWSRDKHFI